MDMQAYMANSWQLEAVVRLLVAATLGALIGLEREVHGRWAGLRTHLLVSLGAALAMVVSLNFGEVFGPSTQPGIRVDPARLAYSVMAGVGFLGAGAIIHQGLGVRGLTTAASLWCAAAIGLAAGFGMFIVALAATALVLFALRVLEFVEQRLTTHSFRQLSLVFNDISADLPDRTRQALEQAGASVSGVHYTRDFQSATTQVVIAFSITTGQLPAMMERLEKLLPNLRKLSLE